MVEIGISHIPVDPHRSLELARTVENAGLEWFGIADSPHLFGSCYPTIQHVLNGTTKLKVGAAVTNPVTRHPSVHGADLVSLAQISGGRAFLGMGAGDSALHTLGLKPASPQEIAEAFAAIRARVGDDLLMLTAASGPVAARAIRPEVDGIMTTAGVDSGWANALMELADEASGKKLQRWMLLPACLVANESEVPRARAEVRSSVVAVGRHALGPHPERRGVPADLAPRVAELMSRYDFSGHAKIGGPNDALLSEFPEVEEYLVNRFAITGTPEQAAARVADFVAATGLDGIFLASTVTDPITHARLVGEKMAPLVRERLAAQA